MNQSNLKQATPIRRCQLSTHFGSSTEWLRRKKPNNYILKAFLCGLMVCKGICRSNHLLIFVRIREMNADFRNRWARHRRKIKSKLIQSYEIILNVLKIDKSDLKTAHIPYRKSSNYSLAFKLTHRFFFTCSYRNFFSKLSGIIYNGWEIGLKYRFT